MRSAANKFTVILEKIALHFSTLSCIALFIMMLFMTFGVLMRFIFQYPLAGSYELVEHMMLVVVACTLAYSQVKKRHIRVDVLISRFSAKMRCILDLVIYIVFAAAVGFCAYQQYFSAMSNKAIGSTSMLLLFQLWPFYLLLAIAMSIFFLAALADCLKQIFTVIDTFGGKSETEAAKKA